LERALREEDSLQEREEKDENLLALMSFGEIQKGNSPMLGV